MTGARIETLLWLVQRASAAEIAEVEGMDSSLAIAVRETLDRITESTILDQYA